MRITFMGSPGFAVPALDALVEAGHEVAAVYCQPPRPAGRGKADRRTAVHERADALGLEVRTPRTLRDPQEQEKFAALGADLAAVAAYGLILPRPVLEAPRLGCVNIHASLLPRWRGAAPIQRAILAGDAETGISIMQMDAGLDTGGVLLKYALPITQHDTAGSLHDKLAALGATGIVEALARLDSLRPVPQPNAQATYAAKISSDEARLDWQQDATTLARQIRAYNPVPGAFTTLNGEILKIWRAEVCDATGNPGERVQADRGGLRVACGSGGLHLLELQAAGKKRLDAAAFIAGRAWQGPIRFGTR